MFWKRLTKKKRNFSRTSQNRHFCPSLHCLFVFGLYVSFVFFLSHPRNDRKKKEILEIFSLPLLQFSWARQVDNRIHTFLSHFKYIKWGKSWKNCWKRTLKHFFCQIKEKLIWFFCLFHTHIQSIFIFRAPKQYINKLAHLYNIFYLIYQVCQRS